MAEILKVARAFIVRDALMAVSYRMDFVLRILSIVLTLVALYFVSRLVGEKAAFDDYGGYYPFAVIGLAMMSFFYTGYRGFSNAIRAEQMMGTLEAMLMTPARISFIVLASSIWGLLWATLTALIYITAATIFYGIELHGNIFHAFLILFLTTLIFAGLGIISASFILVFKRGNPMGLFFGAFSMLLGGVFFPVNELPSWLQKISYILPITHGLDGLRNILLKGQALSDVLPQIVFLMIFAGISVPLSLFCFKKALSIAKRGGTLVQY